MKLHFRFFISFLAVLLSCFHVSAESKVKLTLHLDQQGVSVSPMLYGLMTEEINYSYEGGLYAELIRNRSFKDDAKTPAHWALVSEGDAKGIIELDKKQPVTNALTVCLRLDADKTGKRIGIANDGFWGIPVKPNTTYTGRFYAKTTAHNPSLTVGIESPDGSTNYAQAVINGISDTWQQYEFTLTTSGTIEPTKETRFVISTSSTGKFWFNQVSLFPPAYNHRGNGTRQDLMNLMGAMNPKFLRFPGGNYVEGEMFSSRFDWKKTIGKQDQRPGHMSPWKYYSTDGMGLLEFLEWCEDLKMEPLLAVFAGYTLNKDYLEAGPMLTPFVNDALDEIEYITGDATTKWGAQRVKDGHPEPFKLTYVEIGNEDGFDLSGSYADRYLQFYDAIKAKYPELQPISTVGGGDPLGKRVRAPIRNLEIVDEHYYHNAFKMYEDASKYDSYDRKGPKVFVGEWATREGAPTTNMNAALGDAAWMTGMERNSDIVIMSCYAPLFVNVNPGGMQWKSNLIGYDALNSYGSPSYYAQKMFSTNLGDKVIPSSFENMPLQKVPATKKDSAAGHIAGPVPTLFSVTTKDTKTGNIYIKVVNTVGNSQTVSIQLEGVKTISSKAQAITLKSGKTDDTNSIKEPQKIVPVTTSFKGVSKNFSYNFPAYSVTVIKLATN